MAAQILILICCRKEAGPDSEGDIIIIKLSYALKIWQKLLLGF